MTLTVIFGKPSAIWNNEYLVLIHWKTFEYYMIIMQYPDPISFSDLAVSRSRMVQCLSYMYG